MSQKKIQLSCDCTPPPEEELSLPSKRSVSGLGLAVDKVEVDSRYWAKLSWSPTPAVKFIHRLQNLSSII